MMMQIRLIVPNISHHPKHNNHINTYTGPFLKLICIFINIRVNISFDGKIRVTPKK